MALVVPVHIHEAVAFGHLGGARRHNIEGAPVGVAEHLAAILDGLVDRLQVALEIVDAVIVVDGAVGLDLIVGAHAVFSDEQRLVEQVGDLVADIAQAHGVNLPAEGGALQVGVGVRDKATGVAASLFAVLVGVAAVVAEGDEIHRVGGYHLKVLGLGLEMDAVFPPGALDIAGIAAVDLHIHEEVLAAAAPVGPEHVHRVAGCGVQGAGVDHAAILAGWVDGAQQGDGLGGGYEHVVGGLVHGLGLVFALGDADAAGHKVEVQHVVHFVEGQPVFDPVVVPLKDGFAVVEVKVDGLAVAPAAVVVHQIEGRLIVGQGDDGLDAQALHLIEQFVVEPQALLAGLGLVPVGKDAAPGDGQPEAVHPHLGHQLDILFVVVVAVHRHLVGVVFAGVLHIIVGTPHSVGGHVRDTQAPAFGTLALVGSHGAAPEEPFGERFLFSHGSISPFYSCSAL